MQVVVAFRGTESMQDWRTDCAALFKTVVADPATGALRTLGDVSPDARRGLNLGPFNMLFRPMIHSGFYNAYRCGYDHELSQHQSRRLNTENT